MQSSPPERAWPKPSSPTQSQYSLDLAALDLDSRSGASTPLPEQQVDGIRSEDIDGPSDFTVNMEGWFRGGTVGRGSNKGMKKALESLRERRDEEAQTNGGFLGPQQRQDDEQTASHHTPSNSPPPDSVWNLRSQQGHQSGQDVSEWDPYTDGHESTPGLSTHKQFLQPTVEDYYSELTPARLPSMRQMKSSSSHTRIAHREEEDANGKQPLSPGRPSSERSSPVRSPARSPTRSPDLQRAAPRQFSSQSTEAAFEKQFEDVRAKCKQLELLNAALSQAVDEERRMRAEEKAAHDERLAHATARERELVANSAEADLQQRSHMREVSELKAKVEQHERERGALKRDSELMRQRHTEDIRRISGEEQREKSAQNEKIRTLEQDLELAVRNRDDAEEAERAVREELDQHHAELEHDEQDDLDRMQSDLTQIEDPEDRLNDLQDQLQEAKTQIDKLVVAKKQAEQETVDARNEIASLQWSQAEVTRVSAEHRRAVGIAEELQLQLKKAREQFSTEQTAHKAEIDRMRNDAGQASPPPSADVEELRSRIEDMQTTLNTAILERDAVRDDLEAQQSTLNATILERDEAHDALATAQTALQQAKDALTEREAIDKAVDAKVSAAIAKREAYWRGRLEASEKERKVMVKALLRQWGREEVGITEEELHGRQGYEYQYSKGPEKVDRRRSSRVDPEAGA